MLMPSRVWVGEEYRAKCGVNTSVILAFGRPQDQEFEAALSTKGFWGQTSLHETLS